MTHTQTRRALGLTQPELASILNVHYVTVSRWENGYDDPNKWASALLDRFRVAAERKDIKGRASKVLVARGAIAALYFLLAASHRSDLLDRYLSTPEATS